MDWAPPLTHREHKVLIILAENARLPSRETWDSVESPRILHRARLNRREMYVVLDALVSKGCVEKVVWGGHNHRAKYRIGHLARPAGNQAQCAQNQHTENQAQCVDLQHTEPPSSVCAKTTPRLPTGIGRVRAGLESSNGRSQTSPGAAKQRRAEGGPGGSGLPPGTAADSSLANEPAPPQSLRDHDGPEPYG